MRLTPPGQPSTAPQGCAESQLLGDVVLRRKDLSNSSRWRFGIQFCTTRNGKLSRGTSLHGNFGAARRRPWLDLLPISPFAILPRRTAPTSSVFESVIRAPKLIRSRSSRASGSHLGVSPLEGRGLLDTAGGAAAKLRIMIARNQAALSIVSVCVASLSMTVANKVSPAPLKRVFVKCTTTATLNGSTCGTQYIVSGRHFSMNFLMLAVQSVVSAAAVWSAKKLGVSAACSVVRNVTRWQLTNPLAGH